MSNKELIATVIAVILLIVTTITISLQFLPLFSSFLWVIAAFVVSFNIIKSTTNKGQ
jgi:hypothetical protein